MKLCSVDKCDNKQFARNLCSHHDRKVKIARYPLYATWKGMQGRCCIVRGCQINANTYFKKGIRVCDRWTERYPKGIENFTADMGPKPTPEHSIDRIDNDGPYSPENCRWATYHEQRLNLAKPGRTVGVSFSKHYKQWIAHLQHNKVVVLHQMFPTEQAAINARLAAVQKYIYAEKQQ